MATGFATARQPHLPRLEDPILPPWNPAASPHPTQMPSKGKAAQVLKTYIEVAALILNLSLEIRAKLPAMCQMQYLHGPFTLSECCPHTITWS